MISVGSKTPQLLIELSTSDEYTPGSVIQLQEVIGLNVSVTLPEVSTCSGEYAHDLEVNYELLQ